MLHALKCYGSAKHALVTVTLLATVVSLFCIPLILRYRVYTDYYAPVISSDIVPVNNRISTIWCSSQHLQMNSSFSVYALPGRPRVAKTSKRKEFYQKIVLRNEGIEYWAFHLLDGSVMNVSACARLSGASVTVIKGHHRLRECLQQYNSDLTELDEHSLESSLDDYRQSSSMSSSEGFFSNETADVPFKCVHALKQVQLNASFSCTSRVVDAGRKLTYDNKLSIQIPSTGYYYVVFNSDSYLDLIPNEVFAHFSLDRRIYNLTGDHANCTGVTSCNVRFSFASRDFVVVEVTQDAPEIYADTLVSTCLPRKELYFVFFVLMASLILICAFQ